MDSQYFYGTFEGVNFDRRRLALPSKLRSSLKDNQVVLTIIGEDKCIFGYPKNSWEQKIVEQELSASSINSGEGRQLRRNMFSNASIEDLDEQGRFVISQILADKAGITSAAKVTIIGTGDHFEIWDSKNWENYSEGTSSSYKNP